MLAIQSSKNYQHAANILITIAVKIRNENVQIDIEVNLKEEKLQFVPLTVICTSSFTGFLLVVSHLYVPSSDVPISEIVNTNISSSSATSLTALNRRSLVILSSPSVSTSISLPSTNCHWTCRRNICTNHFLKVNSRVKVKQVNGYQINLRTVTFNYMIV